MKQLNPLLEWNLLGGLFGRKSKSQPKPVAKPKEDKSSDLSKDAQDLMLIVAYVITNMDKDPFLIEEYKKLKSMDLFTRMNDYTNIIQCAVTVINQIQKYKIHPNALAQGSRSAKRLLQWGREKGIVK